MKGFMKVCILGIVLMTSYPYPLPLVDMYLRIARQYLDKICKPYYEHVKGGRKVPCRAEKQLIVEFERLQQYLQHVQPTTDNGWWQMTIFEPIFAALASRFSLGTGFGGRINLDNTSKAWLVSAYPYMPATVVFDVCCFQLDTTVALWGKLDTLQAWERKIREKRMLPIALEEFQHAREDLKQLLTVQNTNPEMWCNRALVTYARSSVTLSPIFHENSRGHLWVTYRKSSLSSVEHIEQSSACQVLFDATLMIPNGLVPWKRLGENFSDYTTHQCAEALLCSRIAEQRLQSALDLVYVMLVPISEMLSVATKWICSNTQRIDLRQTALARCHENSACLLRFLLAVFNQQEVPRSG